MRFMVTHGFVALVAGIAFLILSLSMDVAWVSAASPRHGEFHGTMNCLGIESFTAGEGCTILSSNLPEIPVPSFLRFSSDQQVFSGVIDSNVTLVPQAFHPRAIGRCILDVGTEGGLCTFSDGFGELTGFEARLDLQCALAADSHCTLDGPYRFNPKPFK